MMALYSKDLHLALNELIAVAPRPDLLFSYLMDAVQPNCQLLILYNSSIIILGT